MGGKRSKKQNYVSQENEVKVVELQQALEREQVSRAKSQGRQSELEREIEGLRDQLVQATQSESIQEIELQKRVRRLEVMLTEASERLSQAHRKVSTLQVEKKQFEMKTNYSPFTKQGWWLMAFMITAAIFVTMNLTNMP